MIRIQHDAKIENYILNNEFTESKQIVENANEISEKMDVTQGKLVIGLDILSNMENLQIVSLVYNAILGDGANSMMFQNVREKYSLAYYAFSRLDKFKGIMGISSGIEQQNYQKALDTILEQVEDMKKGNITEYEYNTTVKTIENSLNSMKDEQLSLVQCLDIKPFSVQVASLSIVYSFE